MDQNGPSNPGDQGPGDPRFGAHAARARQVYARFQTGAGAGRPIERALWIIAALFGLLLGLVLLLPLLLVGVLIALGLVAYTTVRRAFASGRGPSLPRDDGRRNVRVINRDNS